MRAALYARKSNEQEDARSVTGQIADARAFAQQQGWVVDEKSVWVDDGISGAEFENRPGLQTMLASLRPRPPFQVLIVTEESRLGREQMETGYIIKRILQAGVAIWTCHDGKEIAIRNSTDKLLRNVTGHTSEQEREKAGERTHRRHSRMVLEHKVVGGRVYGYRNRDVMRSEPDKDGNYRRSHVVREVNEAEAVVVRRIFELCASGKGFKRIAVALNDAHVPSPPPSTGGRKGVVPTRAWAPTTIRDILHRELYRGVVVWNRSKKRDPVWGHKVYAPRQESDWHRIEQPELQIVSEELWQAAHDRLAGARAAYLRKTNGQLWGHPGNGVESRYLLTGMVLCGLCGGSMVVMNRPVHDKKRLMYVCSNNRYRGRAVCKNSPWVPVETADRAVLDSIAADLLTEAVLQEALRQAMEIMRPSTEANVSRRTALAQESAKLGAELTRLTEALAAGGDMPSLVAAMKPRERRLGEVAGELRALDGVAELSAEEMGRLQDSLVAQTHEWQTLLRATPTQGRQILRRLLVGRLTFTPHLKDGQYEWRGTGTADRLLVGVLPVRATAMVTPAGFEPAISTLKGSRPGPG